MHAVSCVAWTRFSMAALAVLIVRLRVEAEFVAPVKYWDASFPSRSFDVYGQYVKQLLRALRFSRTRTTISRTSHLFPAGLA